MRRSVCAQSTRGGRGHPRQSFRRLKAIPLTSSDPTSSEATSGGLTSSEATSGETATGETTAEAIKNPCEREVSVEVGAEEVAREWKNALARFQKHARIPGFRNGKVPATLIRSKFAEDIKSEVVEHLVPHAFREETKTQN